MFTTARISTVFHLPFCLFLSSTLFLALIGAGQEEVTISEAPGSIICQGDDSEPPGVWQAVRNIASDPAKLRVLCERAHNQTGSPDTDVIDRVMFEPETMSTFKTPTWGEEQVVVDIVSYNVTRQKPSDLLPGHVFYFIKGAKKDCVWYMYPIRWRQEKPLFRHGSHLCGIEFPF